MQNVQTENFERGIQIEGCNNITVRNCISLACQQWGYCVQNCDTVLFEDCVGRDCQNDGLKLERMANNITIRRGEYSHNGLNPGIAGDGIDVFGGGMHVLIEDVLVRDNEGNGINVKTDALSRDFPEIYGVVTDVTLRRCIALHNSLSGFTAYSLPIGDTSIPLLDVVLLEDCVSQQNGWQDSPSAQFGLHVSASNITVDGFTGGDNWAEDVRIDVRTTGEQLSNITGEVVDLR